MSDDLVSVIRWRDAKTDPPALGVTYAEGQRSVMVLTQASGTLVIRADALSRHPRGYRGWAELPRIEDALTVEELQEAIRCVEVCADDDADLLAVAAKLRAAIGEEKA